MSLIYELCACQSCGKTTYKGDIYQSDIVLDGCYTTRVLFQGFYVVLEFLCLALICVVQHFFCEVECCCPPEMLACWLLSSPCMQVITAVSQLQLFDYLLSFANMAVLCFFTNAVFYSIYVWDCKIEYADLVKYKSEHLTPKQYF